MLLEMTSCDMLTQCDNYTMYVGVVCYCFAAAVLLFESAGGLLCSCYGAHDNYEEFTGKPNEQ